MSKKHVDQQNAPTGGITNDIHLPTAKLMELRELYARLLKVRESGLAAAKAFRAFASEVNYPDADALGLSLEVSETSAALALRVLLQHTDQEILRRTQPASRRVN